MADARAASIERALVESLRELRCEPAGKLAFLALTRKSERHLCDLMAWRLQRRVCSRALLVRCEKRLQGEDASVDIAVMRDGEPIALVEAKQGYTFDLARLVLGHSPTKNGIEADVRKDIEKQRCRQSICERRYILLFFAHPRSVPPQGVLRDEYHSALAKWVEKARAKGIPTPDCDRETLDRGFRRLSEELGGCLHPVCDGHSDFDAGDAFETNVRIFYWLLRVVG